MVNSCYFISQHEKLNTFSAKIVMMVFLHYTGDMKTFPYGLPDPVSFDSNFIDKRSTLIILAVGRYLKPLLCFVRYLFCILVLIVVHEISSLIAEMGSLLQQKDFL
jgi:hypothetical protein